MRIDHYDLHRMYLPYERMVRWASIEEAGAEYLLLRIVTDDGRVAVAEATAKPTWAGITMATLVAMLVEVFLPRMKEMDLLDDEAFAALLRRIPENTTAKSMLDDIRWDLRAQIGGRPLWSLWNGRSSVDVSWIVSRQAPKAMAQEAATMVDRYGFRALKVKGGQGPETDFTVLAEIRAAVGDKVLLYVDVNSAYKYSDVGPYIRTLAEAGVVAIEDPCALAPDARLTSLQRESPIPIIIDFPCITQHDAMAFLNCGAKALSIKPGRVGLSEARALARLADAHGGMGVIGLFGEARLGTLYGLQFAATATPAALPAELTNFLLLKNDIFLAPYSVVGGAVQLPQSSSMAELIDWDQVRRIESRAS